MLSLFWDCLVLIIFGEDFEVNCHCPDVIFGMVKSSQIWELTSYVYLSEILG